MHWTTDLARFRLNMCDHKGGLVEAYAMYFTSCSLKEKASHIVVTKRDPKLSRCLGYNFAAERPNDL